jgi:ubiquinone/menaquinone biosynthesis C-methylase UbiE
MSFYEEHILPRAIDFALSREEILRLRARVVQGLSGDVLEIGFGSGLNLPYLPPSVRKLYAVDPSALGRKLARKRLAASPVAVEWSGLDGQKLALDDGSVDAALSTFTFCTVSDLERTLLEVRRVLKPGGHLHFLEHGRSHEPRVAKWQDRLTPLQRRIAGGCTLNRPIADHLRNAGFCLDSLENYQLPGPKFAGYMYEGRAHACA